MSIQLTDCGLPVLGQRLPQFRRQAAHSHEHPTENMLLTNRFTGAHLQLKQFANVSFGRSLSLSLSLSVRLAKRLSLRLFSCNVKAPLIERLSLWTPSW